MDASVNESGRWMERRQQSVAASFPLTLPDGGLIPAERRTNERRARPFLPELLLFRDIRDERLVRVLASCPVRAYRRGEVLLAPGQPNHDIYLVLSGQLSVRIGADAAGPAVTIERGECVGELSIIDGKPVSACVTAETDSRVLVVPDVVFWSQVIALPGVARNLLTILSERMRQDNDIIMHNMRQRLQYEHIEKELHTARAIQSSMLPHGYPLFPDRREFDVYALMDPAKDVGGDFFDAFVTEDEKLFFAIGDVSGKGIAAALFMVRTVTLLRMEASRDAAPHEVMARVNRQLCRNNDTSMFVTVFCASLDLKTGTLTTCNGGHDAPLFGRIGAGFDWLASPAGVMLGVSAEARFSAGTMALQPGDLVLCYTDGVTEAMNRAKEQFTDARLRQCLAGMEDAQPAHLARMLHAEIRAFAEGAPQSDDIAMLVLKYAGASGAAT